MYSDECLPHYWASVVNTLLLKLYDSEFECHTDSTASRERRRLLWNTAVRREPTDVLVSLSTKTLNATYVSKELMNTSIRLWSYGIPFRQAFCWLTQREQDMFLAPNILEEVRTSSEELQATSVPTSFEGEE